jgi:hypothetical protein
LWAQSNNNVDLKIKAKVNSHVHWWDWSVGGWILQLIKNANLVQFLAMVRPPWMKDWLYESAMNEPWMN